MLSVMKQEYEARIFFCCDGRAIWVLLCEVKVKELGLLETHFRERWFFLLLLFCLFLFLKDDFKGTPFMTRISSVILLRHRVSGLRYARQVGGSPWQMGTAEDSTDTSLSGTITFNLLLHGWPL